MAEILTYSKAQKIVTLEGIVEPISGFSEHERIPTYLLHDNPELLREMTSYKLYNDKNIMISEDKFYKDKWNPEPYRISNLNEFLTSIARMVRRPNSLGVHQVGEDILVLGYDNKRARNTGVTVIPNTGTADFKVFSYIPKSNREKELMLKYIHEGYSMAVLQCLIVASEYSDRDEKMYEHFKRKTKSKVREIYAPKNDVKEALRHLLLPLNVAYDMRRKDSNQFAYTTGRSIKDNATVHKNRRYMLKCDIKGFFDQCNWGLVQKYLGFIIPPEMKNDRESMAILKEMMINPDTGGLYQGSPISGAITNAIMKPAAKYMKNIFENEGLNFSVYADDITLSSHEPIERNKAIGKIRFVFEELGLPFKLHPKKTQLVSHNGRKVTGVRINHRDELTIGNKHYRLLRSILHNLSVGKEVTMHQRQLLGHMNFFKFIDESGKCGRLLTKYEEVLKKEFNYKMKEGEPVQETLDYLFERSEKDSKGGN